MHSFGHGGERFPNEELNFHEVDEQLVLEVKYPGERIVKNGVKMNKGADRFVEPL